MTPNIHPAQVAPGFWSEKQVCVRTRCVARRTPKDDKREFRFWGTYNHVSIMPVVSGDGQTLVPAIWLPGKKAKHWECAGALATSSTPFQDQTVSSCVGFHAWTQSFSTNGEPTFRRRQCIFKKKSAFHFSLFIAIHVIFLVLYFDSKQQYFCLWTTLPSHVIQPLDANAVGLMKENFKWLLTVPSIYSTSERKKITPRHFKFFLSPITKPLLRPTSSWQSQKPRMNQLNKWFKYWFSETAILDSLLWKWLQMLSMITTCSSVASKNLAVCLSHL